MISRTGEPRTMKVTKCAERKVNLEGISSRYDNISCGTIISYEFEFTTEEELQETIRGVSELAVVQTETDIRNNLIMLKVLNEDIDNDCLLGNGPNLEYTDQEIENAKVLIARTKKLEKRKEEKQIEKTDSQKEEKEEKKEKKKEKKKEEIDLDIDDDDILFGGTESVDDVLAEEETASITNADDVDLFGDDDEDESLIPPATSNSEGVYDSLPAEKKEENEKEEEIDFADFTGGILDD